MATKSKKAKAKADKKKEYHRAHLLKHFINASKLKEVAKVYKHYRKAEARISKDQWRLLQQGNFKFSINRGDLPESLKFPLIKRYLREAEHQAVGILQSFLSNRENEFRRWVASSSLEARVKTQLYKINAWNAWYYRSPEDIQEPEYFKIKNHQDLIRRLREKKIREKEIKEGKTLKTKAIPYLGYPKEVFKLARWIMRGILTKNKKPSFNKSNMKLSANVAEIIPRKDPTLPLNHLIRKKPCKGCIKCKPATSFDFWVKFSTIDSGYPIQLPLEDSSYRKKQGGKLCQSLQLNYTSLGELQAVVVQEKPMFKLLSLEEKNILWEKDWGGLPEGIVELDTGLVVALATSKGDLHGLTFFESLKNYDAKLQSLVKHLTKNRISLRSNKKYLHLTRDIRFYIKNEFNRIINRIVEIHLPSRIVIDQLDFKDSHLSRQMNRILRNCGLGTIKKKLESLEEEYGIETVYVNPAFTSKECNNCGYPATGNRQGRNFKCLFCGYTIHADVGGARNHGARSSRSYPLPITLDTSVKGVLESLIRRFLDTSDPLHWSRRKRLRSKAKVLMLSNPYFKEYWGSVAKGFS